MPFCLFPVRRRILRRLLPLAVVVGLPLLLTAPAAFAQGSAVSAPAAIKPVTPQELVLLLHGGYTGDEVLRETAGRPLLAPLDDATEKTLRAAGADQRFIDALRTTRHPLTDDEAGAARQRQADMDARNAEGRAAYISRMAEANKHTLEVRLAERKQSQLSQMAEGFHGKLVAFRDGQLQPCADAATADKKLFAFYFSAQASPQCRQFTPSLLKFYQDFEPKHPAFEVVFVSEDHSAPEMANSMRQDAMPWPALAYERRAQETNIMKLAEGGSIPRLVLVDGAGRLVSDSYVDGKYVGPQHVLDDLIKLAAAGGN